MFTKCLYFVLSHDEIIVHCVDTAHPVYPYIRFIHTSAADRGAASFGLLKYDRDSCASSNVDMSVTLCFRGLLSHGTAMLCLPRRDTLLPTSGPEMAPPQTPPDCSESFGLLLLDVFHSA